jgi:hypothetical protein
MLTGLSQLVEMAFVSRLPALADPLHHAILFASIINIIKVINYSPHIWSEGFWGLVILKFLVHIWSSWLPSL